MLVLVRGDPAFTKTEVIGLDILAPRHPNLYALIVGRLGYDIDTTTNVVRYAHSYISRVTPRVKIEVLGAKESHFLCECC